MQQHLDWHFRQKRKKSEVKRQQESRQFYCIPENFFIFDNSPSIEFPQVFPSSNNATESAPEIMKVSKIVFPSNLNSSTVKCAVCHEEINKEWDSELEEFVLVGVILTPLNDVCIYH